MTIPGPHPESPKAESGDGLVLAVAFFTSVQEMHLHSAVHPQRSSLPREGNSLSSLRDSCDVDVGQGSGARRAQFRDLPLGTVFLVCKVGFSVAAMS